MYKETSHSALVRKESTNHTLITISQLLLAGATRRKMRAEDRSVSVPERDRLMRDSVATMALINAIMKGEDPAVKGWPGVLTVLVGRNGGAGEPERRCTGLWRLLCGFFRHILIVYTYTTGK